MAFLNYEPTEGELPPQAPAPTQTLSDFAAPAAQPSPVEDLRRANFGDAGAANYDALVAAGARRPMAGITGMAGVPVAPSGGLPGGTSGGVAGDLMQLFGDVATGAAGGDPTRAAAQRALVAQREQAMAIQQQQFVQTQAINDNTFYKSLKEFAPQQRPGLVAEYFGKQGRPISGAMANVVSDQQLLVEMSDPAVEARLQTDPAFRNMYIHAYEKPELMATFRHAMRKTIADADKAVDDAAITHVNALGAAPLKILEIQKHINEVGKLPSASDQQQAATAGYTFVEMAVPGVPGGATMWKAVPLGRPGGPGATAPGAEISAQDFLSAPAPTAPAAGGAAPSSAPGVAPVPGMPGVPTGPLPRGATGGVMDPTAALTPKETRSPREHQFQKGAREELEQEVRDGKRKSYTELDVLDRVENKRIDYEAKKTSRTQITKIATEGMVQAVRAKELIDNMDEAVQRYGLAEDQLTASTTQPLQMLWDRITNDPAYSVLSGFDATLSNIARGLGEKGVLTDPDINRITSALTPRVNDTVAAYQARVDFVRAAIDRSNAALQRAQKEGFDPHETTAFGKMDALRDLTYEGEDPGTVPRGARYAQPMGRVGRERMEAAHPQVEPVPRGTPGSPVTPSQEIIGQSFP